MRISKKNIAKPFLKWAGGKTQLIDKIEEQLPKNLQKSSFTYVEPFVGSGAVLFWILESFPNIEKAIVIDINDLFISFNILRVNAKRNINSNTSKRGQLINFYLGITLSGWAISTRSFSFGKKEKKLKQLLLPLMQMQRK